MTSLAPIVLFCYNRPRHTEQTLLALSVNLLADQSELFVFCDGPKPDADLAQQQKIEEVRRVVKSRNWCGKVTVIESETNKGLANSVIEGVTRIVNEFGKVIVLEDDLITSKYFLEYMNTALEKYMDEEKVMQISGHQFPIFYTPENVSAFVPFATSWGWATWKRAWKQFSPQCFDAMELLKNNEIKQGFDVDGVYPFTEMLKKQLSGSKNIDSWAVRWWWRIYIMKGLTLFPAVSLVSNIGFGVDATHTTMQDESTVKYGAENRITSFPELVEVDYLMWASVKGWFRKREPKEIELVRLPWWKRIFK
jgi:hypothetical protein